MDFIFAGTGTSPLQHHYAFKASTPEDAPWMYHVQEKESEGTVICSQTAFDLPSTSPFARHEKQDLTNLLSVMEPCLAATNVCDTAPPAAS